MQRVEGLMRKAIEDYSMIQEGDKIAVALSGGKDSVSLLYALKSLQRYSNQHFDIIAISVNPGFDGFDEELLKRTSENLNVELIIVPTNIKQIVFEERKEKNPCSLCANLRRGILNTTAKKNGCNKIALGHNEDDMIETFFMNLIYAGNISTFSPVSFMDKSGMTLIRPLIYVPEKLTKRFVKKSNIEIMPKICPQDGNSTREYALKLLREIEINNRQSRANIIGAIKRAELDGWKNI